ncbi:MAG: hypothetical protein WCX88_01330 [Patescibacteria group bacterium]
MEPEEIGNFISEQVDLYDKLTRLMDKQKEIDRQIKDLREERDYKRDEIEETLNEWKSSLNRAR